MHHCVSVAHLSTSFCYHCTMTAVKEYYHALFLFCWKLSTFLSSAVSRITPTFKSKVLEFQLIGEGTLPSVCVLRPALKDRTGSPMLQFKRVLVGRKSTLPLVLLNDGNVPSQVRHMYKDLAKSFEYKY